MGLDFLADSSVCLDAGCVNLGLKELSARIFVGEGPVSLVGWSSL